MKVPQFNIHRQISDSLEKEIYRAIYGVIKRGDFILGEDVEKFEQEFAKYIGVEYAVGVANGMDAIKLSFMALGLGKGAEVIVPANTFFGSVQPLVDLGIKPVLVDVDDSYNMDLKNLGKVITENTRAMLPVHLYGNPTKIIEIVNFARENELSVIEDVCQAHGAEYGGCKVGSFGDLGCFSFYPSKNLGSFGDGGIIVSNNNIGLIDRIRKMRNYGQKERYVHERGMNSRLDTMQAAVLRAKLPYLDGWNEQRREAAKLYDELLTGTSLILPKNEKSKIHVYHQYVVLCKDENERDLLMKHLKDDGIDTGLHYPVPIHLQPAFKDLEYEEESFPNAESFAKTCLSLPIFPGIWRDEVKYVSDEIKKFFDK